MTTNEFQDASDKPQSADKGELEAKPLEFAVGDSLSTSPANPSTVAPQGQHKLPPGFEKTSVDRHPEDHFHSNPAPADFLEDPENAQRIKADDRVIEDAYTNPAPDAEQRMLDIEKEIFAAVAYTNPSPNDFLERELESDKTIEEFARPIEEPRVNANYVNHTPEFLEPLNDPESADPEPDAPK